MNNFKKTFEIIKYLFSNKRTRAAIILGIYFIFFIFLGITFRSSQTSVNIFNHNLTSMNSYNYDIEIKYDDNITIVSGNKNNDIETFILNNKKYVIENDVMYELINEEKNASYDYNFYLDISKFTNYNINKYINLSSLINENRVNDEIVKTYNLDLIKFVDAIDEYHITNNKTVEIITYENKKNIYKVKIDLTNYINLDDNANNCTLVINYYNVK